MRKPVNVEYRTGNDKKRIAELEDMLREGLAPTAYDTHEKRVAAYEDWRKRAETLLNKGENNG